MAKTTKRFSAEVRDRAVRLVQEQKKDHSSRWAAVELVAALLMINDWL
jgi:transposase